MNGLRDTRQRRAIRATFAQADRPLHVDEVLRLSQRDEPGTGIATVYRAIKTLVADGWLTPVELPGEPARYEVAGKGHHHHFRCERCARVYDLDSCREDLRRLAPPEFQVRAHDVVLYGLCAACAAASGRPRKRLATS